jgi:ATP-dependent DNA helicase RecQ
MAPKQQIHQALQHYFGYSQFRLSQQQVIEAVLDGKDVLAIMPTGGGKSVCFQLPAVLLPGITIVVSPLIALMKDQVDGLQANGIAAAYLNSSQSSVEQQHIIQRALNGDLKLLYIAPERIPANSSAFFNFLRKINPSLFAIDEAHCISSWGHDFRPEYLKLAILKEVFPHLPVIALTASADDLTQKDILEKLALHNPQVFISSFNRPNIYYYIRKKKDALGQMSKYLAQHPDDCGIIYTLSRASTEGLAEKLRAQGYKAACYHAGMESGARNKVQEQFQRDEVKIIVATIAFGMGIDKSNVRFVIHYDVPKNLEGYYQETGRAGRDGLRSDAITYYSAGDIMKLKGFITIEGNTQQTAIARKKLEQMQEFCESETCRRQYILQYFGEQAPAYCGSCDYCLSSLEEKDVTIDAQKLLSAIVRTGERYGPAYLVDFLRATGADKILPAHKELKTYGIGKSLKKEEWQWLIKQMLHNHMLSRTDDQYGTLLLNDKSRAILKGDVAVKLVMKKENADVQEEDAVSEKDLVKILRVVRQEMADAAQVPAYNIVADNTLADMATYLPQKPDDLLRISGFGDYKVGRYGTAFLNAIKTYCTERNLQSRMPLIKTKRERSTAPKERKMSNTFQVTLQLYQDGNSIVEIAEQRNMAPTTIEGHLAIFVENGELSITKFIEKDRLATILQVVKQSGQASALKPVKDLLSDEYTYGEIRLALAYYKYIS